MGSREIRFFIPFLLPTMNEIVQARSQWGKGKRWNKYSQVKRDTEASIIAVLQAANVQPVPDDWYPVTMSFEWIEANNRRDADNVSAGGRKHVLDALVKAGILENDSRKFVKGFDGETFTTYIDGQGVWVTINGRP